MALALAACSASTDPNEGGLFGGVRGLSTGAYEKRVAEREARLARLHEIQRNLNADEVALTGEQADKRQAIAALQRELAALGSESEQLSLDVERLEEKRGAGDARVAELRTRLAALQQKLDTVNSAATEGAAKREALKRKAAALEKEYEGVLELYLELEQ
ncbi:MAG: hypothetical protein ACREVE_04720 [Gammaproteobacteria bacterium]